MFIILAMINGAGGGGGPSNPCDPDPEVLVTVSGASGTIGWCGQTWNLPGDSGQQKSICPTSYSKQNFGTFPQVFQHTWRHVVSAQDGLQLRREVNRISATIVSASNLVAWGDQGQGALPNPTTAFRDYQYRLGSAGPPTLTDFDLGVMPTTAALATPSAYTILDSQFGSYVNGGITYTWAKGQGW